MVSHEMIDTLIWEEGKKLGRREKRAKNFGRREKWAKKLGRSLGENLGKNMEMANLTACPSPLQKALIRFALFVVFAL